MISRGPDNTNANKSGGIWLRSCRNDLLFPLVIRIPRRIAYRLNAVDTAVKITEVPMLNPSFGVPLSQCTTNSSECAKNGSATMAAAVAAQAGRAEENDSVMAP